MHAIEFCAGLAIVAIVLFDVFGSVLVPRPSHSELRIGIAVARLLAPVWERIARRVRSPRLRQDFRGTLAPAILVAALAAWVASLALGFALMLHSQPGNVDLDEFTFSEALFQSALAISTLGMIHADIHGFARAVVAIAGISGFSMVSLVIAFLLSIQDAMHRREMLVLTLAARAGRPPDALTILTALTGAMDEDIAGLFDAWERWSADVLQSHLSYPVLFRFRSLDENMEWLVCLGAVMDAAAVMQAAVPDGFPRATRAAGFLLTTGSRAVREFARVQRVGDQRPSIDGVSTSTIESVLARTELAPATPAAFTERLDALRAGYAGRLPLIAERLDLVWCDTLVGKRPGGGLP